LRHVQRGRGVAGEEGAEAGAEAGEVGAELDGGAVEDEQGLEDSLAHVGAPGPGLGFRHLDRHRAAIVATSPILPARGDR